MDKKEFQTSSLNLYDVVIRFEQSTNMYSISDLQEAYTTARVLNNWADKQVQDILRTKQNIERVFFIIKKCKGINISFKYFLEEVESAGIIKVLKKYNLYKTYGRGENKVSLCDLGIWIVLASELHPVFFANVMEMLIKGDCTLFDFVSTDFEEEEKIQQARINYNNAWKYFYPEGNGTAKAGYHLHHKDPSWRHTDTERYNKWDINDLEMITASEHMKIHRAIGGLQQYNTINKGFSIVLIDEFKNSLKKIKDVDYEKIVKAINEKIFLDENLKNKFHAFERIQDNISYEIDKGYISTNDQIVKAIKDYKR